jgi:hypothetical protein
MGLLGPHVLDQHVNPICKVGGSDSLLCNTWKSETSGGVTTALLNLGCLSRSRTYNYPQSTALTARWLRLQQMTQESVYCIAVQYHE